MVPVFSVLILTQAGINIVSNALAQYNPHRFPDPLIIYNLVDQYHVDSTAY
jgi:hypothetical protein